MRISDWSSDVCSSDLYIPFNALVPDRLSVVRITRGGGAGPVGAGAVAGTIELGSATRSDLPPYEASLFAGSRDSLMASANFSPDVGDGYVSIGAHYDRDRKSTRLNSSH